MGVERAAIDLAACHVALGLLDERFTGEVTGHRAGVLFASTGCRRLVLAEPCDLRLLKNS